MNVIPLDGREYPPEMVWRAQELYCVVRLSYAKVAAELGVAESTLKRWGRQYDWRTKREELAQAEADIRADIVLARSQMIKELITSKNPVVGFAVAKLEELALKQAEAERKGRALQAQAAQDRREIHSPADAAAALKEAIELKLGRLLAQPEDVDLKAVKELKQALDLLGDMTPANDTEADTGRKGISEKALRKIEELLGL